MQKRNEQRRAMSKRPKAERENPSEHKLAEQFLAR